VAKPRVHEIAKEIGITSKELLKKLTEMGEYVSSASSTLEAPVVRRVREAYAPKAETAAAKPARPAIASTPRKSGQPKYSFYNELQRRSEEVRSENSAKPAPAAKTEKTDNKAEKKPRSPTVKGANYRIQVGAFKDKAQAEQMRKKETLNGLPVEIIYGENKHYLVLIGPYASKDQAIGIQKKLEGQSMQTLLKTFNNAP